MALLHLASLSLPSKMQIPLQFHKTTKTSSSSIQCTASNNNIPTLSSPTIRRSADFKPTVWNYDFIQSLGTKYTEERYGEESRVLREEVRMMLLKKKEEHQHQHQPLLPLELIDVLQRLGVAYHFPTEINHILQIHYNINHNFINPHKTLHATALEFRLLRQHGYNLSTDVFDRFLDEKGTFKRMLSSADIQGILSLYEASFLSMENESILEEARDVSTEYLKEYVRKNKESHMSELINHALEIPLHWGMQRWEALWFIKAYERSPNMVPTLLQLAKLDFNMVQATHLEELKHTSRWWKRIGLMEKLSFSRDRLVEGFLWAVGLNFMPHKANLRQVITKAIALITTIDDIYDVYGTLEELELFTQAVDRWDVNAIDNLPYYMKVCFLALFNFVNELAFNILKEEGCHINSYLKKVWAELCKAYLIEAKWYYSGYTPRLQEYMENAWISITPNVILVHAYFFTQHPITQQDLEYLQQHPHPLFRHTGTIFRFADDLGTSKDEMERGDVAKAIQCYMNEYEGCEADAREYIKSMIQETWKKMNGEVGRSCFCKSFTDIAMNLARTAQWCYLYGDGFGVEDHQTNSRILLLLVDSIH